jgi:sulfite exporter TauE/SafE
MLDGGMLFAFISIVAGFSHTVLGHDHYLPFIVLSRACGWSWRKTFWITSVCGLGHILSAVLLGYLTIHLGFSLERLNLIEFVRGNLAGWALLVFGLIYLTWGMRLAFRRNVDITSPEQTGLLPWFLFIIFILGPCEPLIPIMMYPALQQNIPGIFLTTGLFGATTISTMIAVVTVSYCCPNVFAFRRWRRFSHALAGLVIALCGIGVKFFGL